MDRLQQYYARRATDILELVHQLVDLESPSTDKAAGDRIVRFVAELAREAGGSTEILQQQECGDHLLARWGEPDGGFLLLCHLDTVWPLGTLADRPWHVEGDTATGPGCYDNKASAAIILQALSGLQELGTPPRHPVTVLFNTDEEIGSRSSRAIIEAEAARAAAVLCVECAPRDGSLKVWRKGTGRFVVTAFGRAAHAGIDHEKGVNAIEELAHQILRLQAMTAYDAGTTVSVGLVQGGTRTNTVPDQAQARIDLRVRTTAEGERMAAAIKGLQPVLPGARIAVDGELSRPPMEASPTTGEPFRRAQEIAADLGLALTGSGSGGASDGNFAAALGVPTLDGLGAVGDGAHSLDEYLQISSLAQRTALLAALLSFW